MSNKILNVVLQLRRDNDYNYQKSANTFIPLEGEVCLVDTAKQGLCVIVGDGTSTYGELAKNGYSNDIFIRAYFHDGEFYNDEAYSELTKKTTNAIYIDRLSPSSVYYFDGIQYVAVGSGAIPNANSTTPGIMKLYDVTGENTDGTMTQRAITTEIGKKVSATVNETDETIIFTFV